MQQRGGRTVSSYGLSKSSRRRLLGILMLSMISLGGAFVIYGISSAALAPCSTILPRGPMGSYHGRFTTIDCFQSNLASPDTLITLGMGVLLLALGIWGKLNIRSEATKAIEKIDTLHAE